MMNKLYYNKNRLKQIVLQRVTQIIVYCRFLENCYDCLMSNTESNILFSRDTLSILFSSSEQKVNNFLLVYCGD